MSRVDRRRAALRVDAPVWLAKELREGVAELGLKAISVYFLAVQALEERIGDSTVSRAGEGSSGVSGWLARARMAVGKGSRGVANGGQAR
jgi:hypothetical protein